MDKKNFTRTTVYLPNDLHHKAKVVASMVSTNISHLVRISLSEKIKQLSELIEKEKDSIK